MPSLAGTTSLAKGAVSVSMGNNPSAPATRPTGQRDASQGKKATVPVFLPPSGNARKPPAPELPPSTAPSTQTSNYDDKLKKLQSQIARLSQKDREKNKEIEALQLELKAAKMREETLRRRAESAPKAVGRLAPLQESLKSVDHDPEPGLDRRQSTGSNGQSSRIPPKVAKQKEPVRVKAHTRKNPPREIQAAPYLMNLSLAQLEICGNAGVITHQQVGSLWTFFRSLGPQTPSGLEDDDDAEYPRNGDD